MGWHSFAAHFDEPMGKLYLLFLYNVNTTLKKRFWELTAEEGGAMVIKTTFKRHHKKYLLMDNITHGEFVPTVPPFHN